MVTSRDGPNLHQLSSFMNSNYSLLCHFFLDWIALGVKSRSDNMNFGLSGSLSLEFVVEKLTSNRVQDKIDQTDSLEFGC